MHVGLLQTHYPYPPSYRVEKEARVLLAAGHTVTVMARRGEGEPAREVVEGVNVCRFDPVPRAVKLAGSLVRAANWRYPPWERWLLDTHASYPFQAIHVQDLPAANSAFRVGKRLGVPVVLDFHENYPAAIAAYGKERPWSARVIANQGRYKAYEQLAARQADAVVTVVEEAAERVRELAPDTRVLVFPNQEEADRVVPWRPDPDRFVIAYAGGFGDHRGLDTLVQAYAKVLETHPHAELLIMGKGTPTMEAKLFGLVEELGLTGRVEFTGWVSEAVMRERLADASVGVVPHRRSEHTDTTSPHKIYQYMAAGLPVVTTDCRPLERIVHETGCGLVARSGDAEEMAQRLLVMADHEARLRFSAAGVRASQTTYSLAEAARPLLALYEEFERSG